MGEDQIEDIFTGKEIYPHELMYLFILFYGVMSLVPL